LQTALRFLVPLLAPTLIWVFAQRQFPSLVSIIYAPSDISIHPWTMTISVASALVSSRFDYANSVLFGCPQKHIARLQRQRLRHNFKSGGYKQLRAKQEEFFWGCTPTCAIMGVQQLQREAYRVLLDSVATVSYWSCSCIYLPINKHSKQR